MTGVVEKSRRIARRGLVVLSVTATMAISGVAFANWTLSGTGTGSAEAAVANSLTSTLSVATTLYPGLQTDASITITNPNDFPVTVTAIEFIESLSVTPAEDKTCDASDSKVIFSNWAASESEPVIEAITVPAREDVETPGSITATLEGIVEMGSDSADGCQGASFTQPISITANIGE